MNRTYPVRVPESPSLSCKKLAQRMDDVVLTHVEYEQQSVGFRPALANV